MSQRQRHDGPGVWHHVFQRGVARRVLFADRRDFRRFLAAMACAVRREEIQVHAYALMGTHFHLLIRTEHGTLSRAMKRIQNDYSRWFNRRNRRDGPLYRGRFRSKPVVTARYLRVLVRYIDNNPVLAGLSHHATEYRWGSAWYYARERVPAWLAQEELLRRGLVNRQEDRASGSSYESEVVERRLHSRRSPTPDPLMHLVTSSDRLARWMSRKARLADGLEAAIPVCSARALSEVARAAQLAQPDRHVQVRRERRSIWGVLQAGLLHQWCGCTGAEIAGLLAKAPSTVASWASDHRELLRNDEEYAALCETICRQALDLTYDIQPAAR